MHKRTLVGVITLSASIALAIIMMTVDGWMRYCTAGNGCSEFGLRHYTITNNNGDVVATGTIPSSGDYVNMYDGGSIILATGIIGAIFFIASIVLLIVAHRREIQKYRLVALAGLYMSVFFLLLGIILYAYKQYAGYSFILMTIAGFQYFIGAGFLIGGGWTKNPTNTAKETPDSH